jgi:hypothetical protein
VNCLDSFPERLRLVRICHISSSSLLDDLFPSSQPPTLLTSLVRVFPNDASSFSCEIPFASAASQTNFRCGRDEQ